MHLGQVTEATDDRVVFAPHDHQGSALDTEGGQRRFGLLGAGTVEVPSVDHHDLVIGGPIRQGRTEGQLDHLLVCSLRIITGLGAMGDTAADPDRGSDGAGTGTAGAFLAPGLGTATSDLSTGFGAVGAGTTGGQLCVDHLVHDRHIGLDAEDLLIEIKRTSGLAGDRLDRNGGHQASLPLIEPPLTALRMTMVPPLGPGTDPLTRTTFASGSACTIRRP